MRGESSGRGYVGWAPVGAHENDLVVLSLQFTLVFLYCMSPLKTPIVTFEVVIVFGTSN